ncbi:hypothetical protein WDU94_004425 [Cyamophila willieti]
MKVLCTMHKNAGKTRHYLSKMISKLTASWIFLTISLTLTPDQCFADKKDVTVPLESAFPPPGSPVGRLLPNDKFEKLCQAPEQRELCKNVLQGCPDMHGACAALGKQLGFKFADCKEVIPDMKDKSKYVACSLANKCLPLGHPDWYYVTSRTLGYNVNHHQKCSKNGLSVLVCNV